MKKNKKNDDLATSLLGMSGLQLNMSPLPKKNMTTREILEHRLSNYNDDMELMTPMPEPEVEFDGNNLYVKRNNIKQAQWPSMSGQEGYQNKASTSIANKGPTPEGTYYIDPNKLEERQSFLNRMKKAVSEPNLSLEERAALATAKGKYGWMDKQRSWGNYRVPLEPAENTETFGRNHMYIHGGDELGSAGCIDLGPNMDKFISYIKNGKQPIKVKVKYNSENF